MDPSIDDQLYFLNQNQNQYLNDIFDSPQPPQPHHPPPPHHIDDEPLYVNAKQYFRILKRRVARSRLDEVHRLSRQRKPYLHESRHKHAMRRPRGPGGRFLTAEEIAAQKRAADAIPEDTLLENSPDDPEDDQDHHIPESSAAPDTREHDQPIQPPIVEQRIPRDHHVDDSFFSPPPFRAPSMSIPPQHIPHIASHSHHHSHSRHTPALFSNMPKPLPVNISSPYTANPPPVQMHHVPHPHAHARHHHSNHNNIAFGIYDNTQIQRRNDEMIQFGSQGPTN
ncbi:hypothetical protein MD484_g7158, partial [Candolleomyces efflorescens]